MPHHPQPNPRTRRILTALALPAAALLLLCPGAAATGDCVPQIAYTNPLDGTGAEGLVPHVQHSEPFTDDACDDLDAAGDAAGDLVPHIQHYEPLVDDVLALVPHVQYYHPIP